VAQSVDPSTSVLSTSGKKLEKLKKSPWKNWDQMNPVQDAFNVKADAKAHAEASGTSEQIQVIN
jgi:hypothetical protein